MLDNCLVHELGVEAARVLVRHIHEVVELILSVFIVYFVDLVATVEVWHLSRSFPPPPITKLLKSSKIQCLTSIPDIKILLLFRYQSDQLFDLTFHQSGVFFHGNIPIKQQQLFLPAHPLRCKDAGRASVELFKSGHVDAEHHEHDWQEDV